jgi:hypothetical protein
LLDDDESATVEGHDSSPARKRQRLTTDDDGFHQDTQEKKAQKIIQQVRNIFAMF